MNNPWDDDEIVSSAASNPWDADEVIDDGPGLEIDIVGGMTPAQIARQQQNVADAEASAASYQSKLEELNRQEGIGRVIGLGGRDVLEGLASIPDILISPAVNLANRVLPEQYQQTDLRGAIGYGLDIAGVPRPETAQERVISNVNQALTGAMTGVGLGNTLSQSGNRIASGTGQLLASQPALQAASAVTGASASGLARESGAPAGAQLAAGLIGGLAPAGVTYGAQAGVRGALRGGETGRKSMQENIEAFQQMGGMPSLGQATQGRFSQGAESLLAGAPTSGNVMARASERQAEQIGEGLQDMAESMMRNPSAERAGRAIESGIETFRKNAAATKRALYWNADRFIPPQTPTPLANTIKAVSALTTPTQGATATTAQLINPRIASLRNALEQDLNAGGGQIPYEALKRIRTDIGEQLNEFTLSPDTPTRELRQLYKALSQDMEASARTQGAEAFRAAKRANNYTRAVADRLEQVERVVDKNGGPEKVYQAALSGTRDGGTTLRAVMQSLPQEGQKAVTAAVIRRMGLARAGAQTAEGEAFSAQTFLTNWNNLSKEAKRSLFDRYGPGFSRDMDKVAKVAQNIRDGSRVFANPSGTANRAAAYTYGASLAASLFDPSLTTTGSLVAGGIGANLWARAMTNPRFVSWLANQTDKPVGAIPAQIQVLNGMAERNDEPELAEIAELLKEAYNRQQQQAKQN